MSRKVTDSNDEYPSVMTFFAKSKHRQDFSDKNQFIQNKLNSAIENIHTEPNQSEQITEDGDQIQFPLNDVDHDDQILILTGKIRVLEKDLKHAKILLRKASDLNLQKDLEIKSLKQQLNKQKMNEKYDILFQNHSHRFENDEIRKIRSIKAGKRNDSTFVLTILKCLYKNEEAKLNDRRVTAKKYVGTKKIELSAEKKQIMREMLEERVIDELGTSQDGNELGNRLNELNRHMRNALHNSLNAHKKNHNQTVSAIAPKQPVHQSMPIQSQTDAFMPVQPQTTPFQHPQTVQASQGVQHQYYPYVQYSHYPYMMQQCQTNPLSQTVQHPHTIGYSSTPQNSQNNFFTQL